MFRLNFNAMIFFLLISFTCHASEEKTAVFIVGMGRSGTSCTAGVLKILGMEMGTPLAGPRDNNKKGKFEHLPTTQMMQPILKEIGAIWYNPRLFDWETYPRTATLKDHVKEHLAQHFGNSKFFGIKNPEITILLPLFLQAAQELGYTPKIVMVIRHPDETNASIQKDLEQPKRNFYRNIALAYSCAFKYSIGYDMHVVYFDDLLKHPERTINQLKEFLPQLKDYKTMQKELNEFIDPGLKHQQAQALKPSKHN